MKAVSNACHMEIKEVLALLDSSEAGLSQKEAEMRLQKTGPNRLREAPPPSLLRRFFSALADPMVLVLVGAALVSALLREWADAAVILAVVAANTLLSLLQEGKAERAAAALSAMTSPTATLRRDGCLRQVDAAELVPGDIVCVEAGDVAPADIRLIRSFSLAADESSLTGESAAVEKSPQRLQTPKPSLAEQENMLFMGSPITAGRGEGVVTACGMDTQMGRIAGLLDRKERRLTPLQMRLAELSRILSVIVLAISAVVFVLSLTRGSDGILDAFLLAVSLAVAAVPEGLVVVVTLVLSHGMNMMSKCRAIIRRLSAVETLGSVQVICSDKTGTLTENRMQVRRVAGNRNELALAAALCSTVREDGSGGYLGDPTETALAVYAQEQGQKRRDAMAVYPLLAELPFDSSRKRMSTLHKTGSGIGKQYTKGAFEQVLSCCRYDMDAEGRIRPMDHARRQELTAMAEAWSADALRVLACACREGDAPKEEDLVFLGLFGLIDEPRPEAAAAIREAREAGVQVVMVSGDNALTAAAIGRELDLLRPDQTVLSGAELDAMDDKTLHRKLEQIRVFARVRPEDKLRIVRAWQKRGAIVAMTGDGVNDAPALAAADIGVGMGKNGAEVARRAAGLVLADDNFSTIIAAIREGRRIYDNIRKAVQFLLASNLAEVAAIFTASLFGLHLFYPIHLLWINLITDCLPAVALGTEEAEADVMQRPPRPAKESVFARGMGGAIFRQGMLLALFSLLSFTVGSRSNHAVGVTMAFVTLSAGELFHAWNMRSRTGSIFRLPGRNPLLSASILIGFGLDLALLYMPQAATLFHLVPLTSHQLLIAALCAFAIVPGVELEKWLLRQVQPASGKTDR